MAKFNEIEKAASYEGAPADIKKAADEWRNMLFSWLVEPGFYESSNQMQTRFQNLTLQIIKQFGPEKVSHACWYARNVLGMRSASCLVAAVLNDYQFDGKRQFYSKYFRRADDVAELFSAIDLLGSKKSHAVVRAACGYVNSLSEYEVSKYRMEGKKYSMLDVINIVHASSEAVSKLKSSDLQIANTWENSMFKCQTYQEKQHEWLKLITTGSLGIMALLRNLSNIVTYAVPALSKDELKKHVCDILENEQAIKKSLIFPYRLYSAYNAVLDKCVIKDSLIVMHAGCSDPEASSEKISMVLRSLERAFRASCSNVPDIKGSTAVIMDASESMTWNGISEHSAMTAAQSGCLFAASLLTRNNQCDLYAFGRTAKKCDYDFNNQSPFYLWNYIKSLHLGGSTNLDAAMKLIDKQYDRIVLISDMQCSSNFKLYTYLETYPNCKLYSFDLGNYHAQVKTPYENVAYITALNSSAFDLINLMEMDKSIFDEADEKYKEMLSK